MLILFWMVFLVSFLTIWVMRLLKRKFPNKYFYFGEIILRDDEDISIIGLSIRFLIPFIISILMSIVYPEPKLQYILFYGFLTPFLLIWPAILTPLFALNEKLKKRYKTLIILYFIYIAGSMSSCILGYNIYKLLLNIKTINFMSFLKFYSQLHPFFQNLISSAIWTVIVVIFTRFYRSIMKKRLKGHNDNFE